MNDWTAAAALAGLDPATRTRLAALSPQRMPRGTVLFRPGDTASGFSVVLDGRIEVFLTGTSGRELMLYAVEPGQSCVQTTLGLLGGGAYSAEAICAQEGHFVLIPRPLFLSLMEASATFRALVFAAFAQRMGDMVGLLERVSFQSVEIRLAQALLARASGGRVEATQAELAAQIGSAREVVSRRLDAFARSGWVRQERGAVVLQDAAALVRLAAAAAL
ncbi:MAG: Crp/Fnr family transcriptional regulator [Phaeovulum sp.]|uniref:Crp/Fnr family transcriptional regulator n=1 Tax=Phaeovulum sp. TaxID=2934796 RepID=UPI002730CF87|nr:Crp/Fnr family transcriptional regulator [Phaeovulum sp.]MDP2063012.1 Crp/Fnr family transcriptional regulator [Phaeovulum sp.]